VHRPPKYGVGGTRFHDLAQIHDEDVLRKVAHHVGVVGDKEVGNACFGLQALE